MYPYNRRITVARENEQEAAYIVEKLKRDGYIVDIRGTEVWVEVKPTIDLKVVSIEELEPFLRSIAMKSTANCPRCGGNMVKTEIVYNFMSSSDYVLLECTSCNATAWRYK